MEELSPRLRRLDKALSQLPWDSDAMEVSELDGLVAGLLVCPDLILPGEWLSLVWGDDGEDGVIFDDIAQAQRVTGLVMEHYNAVADDLMQGRYAALYDVDTRHDDVLWELWMEGFHTAMELRPEAWLEIARHADPATAAALAGMTRLVELACSETPPTGEEADRLALAAPDLIIDWVQQLHLWRLGNQGPVARATTVKAGRNDPCPCGSGRKFKKCCLN